MILSQHLNNCKQVLHPYEDNVVTACTQTKVRLVISNKRKMNS